MAVIMGSLEAWEAWGRLCAVARCNPEARRLLHAFGGARFRYYLRRYGVRAAIGDIDAVCPEPHVAWQLLESFLELKSGGGTKARKAWIFARARSEGRVTLDALQSGTTLVMRDVVRDFLHHQCRPAGVISLDAPVGADTGGGIPLVDLLPERLAPVDPLARNEAMALGASLGRAMFSELSQRERVALLAHRLGLSNGHPAIVRLAGCGKSRLYDVWNKFLRRLASAARRRLDGEDGECLLAVTLQALEQMGMGAVAWAQAEKRCAPLFRDAGR